MTKRVYAATGNQFVCILTEKGQDYLKKAEDILDAHRAKISVVHEDDVSKVWGAISPEFREGISQLRELPEYRAERILVIS